MGILDVMDVPSTGLFAVDPLADSGGAEAPQFAHLDTCDLSSKHHALESTGVNVKHCCGFVAVE
jgi:hypothetical protein